MLLSACATAKTLIPKLSYRTLRISKKVPGFEYRYCTKRTFWRNKCKDGKWKIDYYDITKPEVREKLINMGFVLKVRKKL